MARLLKYVEQVLQAPIDGRRGDLLRPGIGLWMGLTLACGVLYGAAMGSFGGVLGDRHWQVAISAIKVPLLLLATFAISLPSFFVLNTLLGVRSDFPAVLRALAGSQAGLTIVLAALAPYTLLWYASSASYAWAQIFNGMMFAIATFAAQAMIRGWYRPLIASNPHHRALLRIWLILYTFVGIQMAWVLRPFIGAPGSPIQFFREEGWGNAYIIISRMVWETLGR